MENSSLPQCPAARGPLHVSFDRSRLKDKNIQQIKVLQRRVDLHFESTHFRTEHGYTLFLKVL
ncbi:hypothetical protein CN151_16550 [Sinorhizobium meliloti]|nr:hypothetical protein CN151_16550 [Sinorhizobium meliloti]RVM91145.1 hypothetical protein CN119_20805 [Sinorhizobium meliloti]RVN04222.1 hypothetical protein CN112_25770 [Sinorhizobium meliloti]